MEWVVVAALASLAVLATLHFGLTNRFDNIVYDRALAARQPDRDTNVVIVAIDDQSLAALGRWPWPRRYHADMINSLRSYGAKVIGYDVLFPEPSDDDAMLATAVRATPNLVLPISFQAPGENGKPYHIVGLTEPLASAAVGRIGHVNLVYDDDGVVRQADLQYGDGQDRVPHLTEALYRKATGNPSPLWTHSSDANHRALIPYRGGNGTFPTISFLNVRNGEVPAAFFAGKAVLVGGESTGLHDIHPTPTARGGTAYGVELMANIYDAMATGRVTHTVPRWQHILLSLIPIWLMLVSFWKLRPRSSLVLALTLFAVLIGVTFLLLARGLWIAPGPALLGLLLVYPLWGWRRLQAMDDFVGGELDRFAREDNIPLPALNTQMFSDHVGAQAYRLEHAITEMRGLRRFVSDVLAQLPDPMIVVDGDGRVRMANAAAQSLFGEALYREAAWPMVRALAVDEDRRKIGDFDPSLPQSEAVPFITKDGQVFEMRRTVVRAENGDLRGVICYLADMTARHRESEQREELLQLLTHDMRSPQSSILALLDNAKPRTMTAETIDRIRSYARRTLTLADNFVHLARLKGADFEPEFIELGDLIQEAADGLWTLAGRRNITITVTRPDDPLWVMGEPGTLNRAFTNLFDNAVKYSPQGGTIGAELRRADNHVECLLWDEGSGIDPALAGKLFRRFAKGADPDSAPDAVPASGQILGTGLGLNFVASVIDRHGGTIAAQARPGGQAGALFRITLPLSAEDDLMLDDDA